MISCSLPMFVGFWACALCPRHRRPRRIAAALRCSRSSRSLTRRDVGLLLGDVGDVVVGLGYQLIAGLRVAFALR